MQTTTQLKERIEAIRGRLLMIDFSENEDGWYTCQLHLAEGRVLTCTFDDSLAADAQNALRQDVYAMGVATYDPSSGQTLALHIGELIVIGQNNVTDAELAARFAEYFAEHNIVTVLRQALHEAMTGQTYPVSRLWEMLDAEDAPDGSSLLVAVS